MCCKIGKAQKHFAQRDGGCPIPGKCQGHVGQGSEKPHHMSLLIAGRLK